MSPITSVFVKITALTGMLVGLPLLGVFAAGYPVMRYLEFPPKTRFVHHEPFAWWAFAVIAAAIALVAVRLSMRIISSYRPKGKMVRSATAKGFPWWGWVAGAAGLISWIVAWTRFSWVAGFQPHTFVPLWLSYIAVINALTYGKTGRCMLVDRPAFFCSLFPVSSVFWWYFEYLNRFVQNWYYVGAQYGPWTYFWLATLSFSTVLPAVLGTQEWILAHDWMRDNAIAYKPTSPWSSRTRSRQHIVPWCVLTVSGLGLALIGVVPNYLFPLVWVSPLIIIVSLQALLGERHIVSDMIEGRWTPSISAALAALFCGWFWEMWNYHSLAKWVYSIPFVERLHLFEMPILGYAGYLPFGLECFVVGLMLEGIMPGRRAEQITS